MRPIQILVTLAFLLALYFPVMLVLRSDYKANPPIKSLLIFSIVVAGVLLLGVFRVYGLHLPDWVRSTSYGAIVAALAIQDWTLTKTQNRRSARIAREREEISQ